MPQPSEQPNNLVSVLDEANAIQAKQEEERKLKERLDHLEQAVKDNTQTTSVDLTEVLKKKMPDVDENFIKGLGEVFNDYHNTQQQAIDAKLESVKSEVSQSAVDFDGQLKSQIPDWENLSKNDPNFLGWLNRNKSAYEAVSKGIANKDVNQVKIVADLYKEQSGPSNQANINQGMPQGNMPVAPQQPQQQYPNGVVDFKTFMGTLDALSKDPRVFDGQKITSDDVHGFLRSNYLYHLSPKR